ncbi:SusC/RagA family TonB-linked outer membrane protein [uncultured Muribaculum sp.]|uniref:SusC/RagA family TonB-linked outer membrane protein n=1 Tax=uncultured Muribaculum sp. TaxID=1918613 RepID=UPI0025DF872E|nr:SusC/RagA family TonB-linked outer membrane protein [uncultured Muribaculum sp.]
MNFRFIRLRIAVAVAVLACAYAMPMPASSSPVGATAQATAAATTVNGEVLDANGDPLTGVSVSIEGKGMVGVTDLYGKFTVKASPGQTLLFTYIGFSPTKAKVTGQPMSVTMKEESTALNEVVVTALGIKRAQKALTYNVQEVSADEITGVKDASFVNSLAGKVAGININAASTGVGGSAKVVMRGTKSLTGNNQALYVIDGIPMPALGSAQGRDAMDSFTGMGQSGDGASMINPEDIESISVLSGAAASALYGSDAANGVVLITTRKGREGATRVSYSNSTQFLSAMCTPEFQNTYGANTGDFWAWGDKLGEASTYDPTDFFRHGYNETNAVTITAGNSKNQTFVSLAATNAGGIIENNELARYNFTARNTTQLLPDKIRLDLGASYMNVREQNMLAGSQYMNPLIPLYLMAPSYSLDTYKMFEMYNPDRNFSTQYWPWGNMGLGMQNPYWITQRDMFINHKSRTLITAGLYFDNVIPGLNLSARAKVDSSHDRYERKYAASTDAIFANEFGAYFLTNNETLQLYADFMANYDRKFGDFSVNVVAGASINDIDYSYNTDGGDLNSVANRFTLNQISPTGTHRKEKQARYHDQTQSIFGTAQIGWKSMLYLDATGRIDWASALAGTTKDHVAYPSVGLSAIITEMIPGLRDSFLSFLKVRGSYSEVGNAPRRYAPFKHYTFESGTPSTTPTYPNPNIEPERTKGWELGLSTRLWMDKINLNVSLYKTSTFNQLFKPSLSATSGYSSIYINGGRIDNKGIEVSLALNQPLGPVQWTSNITYTLNRNKIVRLLPETVLPDGTVISQNVLDIVGLGNVKSRLIEGGSIGDLYVTTLQRDHHGKIVVDYVENDVYKDNTAGPLGDGWVYAGNSEPKYTLGWRNSFNWKGLSLGFLVSGRFGGRVVSMTEAYMDQYGTSKASAEARDLGYVLINGRKMTKPEKFFRKVGAEIGENYVYKATNIRLAEISFGYDIPVNRWVSWIKGLNVSFIGRNLFFFYKEAPYDPEITASTDMGWSGMDYFMQPSLRSLGFSVKVNF